MPELVGCPACGCKVQTSEGLLGRTVRCFGCGHRFVARPTPPTPRLPPPKPPPPPLVPRRMESDEDLEAGLPYCPGCGRRVSWMADSCRHCGEEFEDEPPHRWARIGDFPLRCDWEPHRAGLIGGLGHASLVLGCMGMCFGVTGLVGVPLGIAAWLMGQADAEKMREGQMDPTGRRRTLAGVASAKAGVLFGLLFAGAFGLLWLSRL